MVTLWTQIRQRAAEFAYRWRNASYEKGEAQSFYDDFFNVFGVRRATVARFEEHVRKLDNRSGFIDLFWPGVLLVEHKSAGHDLTPAYDQAGDYFDALPERERPRYILVSDFRTFELYDRDQREKVSFSLEELPHYVKYFQFILQVHRYTGRTRDSKDESDSQLPNQWERTFPTGLEPGEAIRGQLRAASRQLIAWPTTLPDGESIDRPELAHLEARIGGSTESSTAVLGTPGCGKSALLSTLARRYAERGWPVLAIKGDMLDVSISNETELGERLARLRQ